MRKVNINNKTQIIEDENNLIVEKDRIFLEAPILDISEDDFSVITYSEQLYYAVKNDAKFIAVDGEYSTGKSSIINLFETKICCNKKEKCKNIFLNINFLNINEKITKKNTNELETIYNIDDLDNGVLENL